MNDLLDGNSKDHPIPEAKEIINKCHAVITPENIRIKATNDDTEKMIEESNIKYLRSIESLMRPIIHPNSSKGATLRLAFIATTKALPLI
tara:strand:- start:657 stop:926 length:270 start_codon:yes stop_codon:yes gene_type:complete